MGDTCHPHRARVHRLSPSHERDRRPSRPRRGWSGRADLSQRTQFPLNVAMLTGAELAPGNRVEVALNGDGTFPRLWDDLRAAQESIRSSCITAHRATWRTHSTRFWSSARRQACGCSSFTTPSERSTCLPIIARRCGRQASWWSRFVHPPVHAPSGAESLSRSRHHHRRSHRVDWRFRHR